MSSGSMPAAGAREYLHPTCAWVMIATQPFSRGGKWGITISKLAHMLPTKSVIWALEQFSNVI